MGGGAGHQEVWAHYTEASSGRPILYASETLCQRIPVGEAVGSRGPADTVSGSHPVFLGVASIARVL